MKSRIIPAQITTVEDKFAGNLSLIQILILMIPIFWATIVFTLLPLSFHINLYKFFLILFVFILCILLSLRIKGKIILAWIIVLAQYNLRPKYYIFNKNDTSMRFIDFPNWEKQKNTLIPKEIKPQPKLFGAPKTSDLVKLEYLMSNPKYSFSLKMKQKGAFYVAIHQIKK